MRGVRFSGKVMWKLFFPGVLMIVISFGSFLIPVNLPMPRVATTMIALLAFMYLYRGVLSQVPATGTSWLEEFYFVGIGFMMLNVFGHIASFRLQKYEYKIFGTLFYRHCDRFCILIGSSTFFLGISCRLHIRDCENAYAAVPMVARRELTHPQLPPGEKRPA